ncbi:MAG: hypothetical protein CVV28_10370 [Methanobacteriales archaeon HGW-Methanobacteriales-1]|nr:MAG: hypothetical protein CVV28_10370 [Methanobacteriales archaeon HGW-Methanobacteriales-1]
MGEFQNTFFILFIVVIIGSGLFFGSLTTSNSANDTNLTNNSSNKTNNTTSGVTPMASGILPSVSLTVTSNVNLGVKLPDGLESSYPSVSRVDVSAWELFPGGDDLNLYVRASGNFISGANNIPLSNFKYNGFSNSALAKTSFTTTNTRVKSWPMGSGFIGSVDDTVYGNYYLTVPMGTTGGTYTTTVYYTAILE